MNLGEDPEPSARPVHDPVLAREDGVWHLFATGEGIAHRSGTDLRAWKPAAAPLPTIPDWGKALVPGVRNPWAPDIVRVDRGWRLYHSLSTFGSQRSAIGLLSSDRLDGPWKDEGEVLRSVPGDPFNAIDPCVVEHEDGRMWLAFGSFWRGIHIVELDRATGKTIPGARPSRIAARPKGDAIEAAFLIRHAGWFWCFASTDYCCRGERSTYKTVVGRARDIHGPFVDRSGAPMLEGGGTELLRSGPRWRGPGHPGLVRDGREWRIAVHAYDAHAGGIPTLRTAIVRWRGGWPEVPDLQDPVPAIREPTGVWEHRVDGGPANQIVLRGDGTFEHGVPRAGAPSDPPGAWTLKRAVVELEWPPRARRGKAIDRVRLAPDGRSYRGENTDGIPVDGTRVA